MRHRPTEAANLRACARAEQHSRTQLKPLAAQVRRALFPSLLVGLHVGTALAGPQGGNVVGGKGSISRPNANTTVIKQGSQNLAIDWQKFNVKSNELVQFQQPGRNAQALNRIFDQNASQIHGRINANGRVLLMNPNGVVFGPNARVNVNALVAAGMKNIPVDDFMAGKYKLEGQDGSDGLVINQGTIEAATGGDVTLVGKSVRNEGVIIAQAGRVNLAAGNKVTLDFDGDGLMRFAVDEAVLDNAQALDAQIANDGSIAAEGGEVVIAASAAKNVFNHAINNTGVIKAGRIDRSGGQIRLVGLGPQASVLNTGTLDVSARDSASSGGTVDITGANIRQSGRIVADASGGHGGAVELNASDKAELDGEGSISATSSGGGGGRVALLGDKVGLVGANDIDVSGATGGGEVLLGGDYQGKNPNVKNARAVYVSNESSIAADALESGDGGKVIVWADKATRFYGTISAQGGAQSGDGGFVEVSGKDYLDFDGLVNTLSVHGEDGLLLLDPADIYIADSQGNATTAGMVSMDTSADDGVPGGGVYEVEGDPGDSLLLTATVETQLQSGNVTVQATGGTAGNGDIFVVDAIQPTGDLGADRALSLDGRDVHIDATIDATGEVGGDHNLSVTITATNNVDIIDGGILSAGGTVDITAGGAINAAEASNATANIESGGGDIILSAATGIGDLGGTGGFDVDAGPGASIEMLLTTSGAARVDYVAADADALTLGLDNGTSSGNIIFESAATGALTLTDANIDGASLMVTSGGSINLNEQLDLTTGAGDVTVTAATSIALADVDNLINAGAGTVTLNATGGTVSAAEPTGNNGVEINTTGSLILNAQSVGTTGNRVSFQNVSDLQISDGDGTGTDVELQEIGGATTVSALTITSATATAGDITIDLAGASDVAIGEGHVLTTVSLNTGSNATFNYTATAGGISVGAIDTGDQNIVITASSGGIDEIADDTAANITTSGLLTLLATGGAIGDNADANAPLDVDVGSLNASTDTGGIFIRELDGLDIVDNSGSGGVDGIRTTAGNAPIEITLAAGDLSLTAPIVADGSGDITLDVAGAITDNDAAVDLQTSGLVALTAGGAIGAAGANGAIDLDATQLQASAADSIFIIELDTATTDGLQIAGTGVQTTANDGDINITVTTGNLTLDEDITADGAGAVNLTVLGAAAALETSAAADDIASATGDITVIADNLNLAGGEITTTGTVQLRPNDTARVINLGNTTGGMDLTSAELDLIDAGTALVIGDAAHAAAINLTDNVTTGNANTTSTVLETSVAIDSDAAANTFTEASLDLRATDIGATNTFGIDSSNIIANASAGAIDITNGATAIDAELDATGTVTFTSGAGITSAGDMSAESFDLTATAGNIVIEHNIATTGAAGSGDIALTATGGTGEVNLDPTGAADISLSTANMNDLVFSASTSIFIDQETATDNGVANVNLSGGNVVIDGDPNDLGNTLGLGDEAAASDFSLTDVAMQGIIDATTAPVVFGDVTTGAVSLDTATDFGARSFSIITGATIDDADGGTSALETTGTLTLISTGAVGSGGDPLALEVANLSLNTAAADITNITALVLQDSTVTGAASIVTSAGNLTINAITATGLTVTLNSAAAILDGNGATANINAATLDATATTSIDLDTNIGALSAAGGAGAIDINEADALTLTSVTTTDGAITIVAGNTVTVTAVDAQDAGSDATHDVSITASTGDIDVSSVSADNSAILIATTGAITDANGATNNITAIDLDATAATGIDLDTTVDTITAAGGNGAITIAEADAVTLTDVATTDGAITVSAGGALTVTAVDAQDAGADESHDVDLSTTVGDIIVTTIAADDQITLNAAGAITDANGNTNNLTALVLDATAATGIDIDTTIGSASAVVSGVGAIDITDVDALTLTNVATADGAITIAAGNTLTVTAVDAQDAGADETHDVNLSTTAGDIDVTLITADNEAILNAAAAITDANAGTNNVTALILDASAASGIDIDTTVDSITASGGAGDITIDEVDAVTLTSVATTDGAITVNAGNTLTATFVDAQDAGADDTHNVVLTTAAGDIALDVVNADNQATINAAAAVTDANADGTLNVTALVLDATAATGIDTDTNVDSITAAGGAGDIDINESDAVTLTNVATTDGAISVAAGDTITVVTVDAQDAGADEAHDVSLIAAAGDITVADSGVSADNDATLSAVGGDITASGGNAHVTALNNISLSAQDNIGEITNFATAAGTALQVSFGNLLTNASITGAGGAINLDVGASLSGGGNINSDAVVIDADGVASAIIQSADDLVFATAAAAFDAGAGDSIGLVAGNDGTGTLTISGGAGLNFAGQNLLLSGTTDVIDDDGGAAARTLDIVAADLGIISGANGGDITLNLNVNNVSADINDVGAGGASLTITETDAINLVDVVVENGAITVNAAGTVTATSVVAETDAEANDVSIATTVGNIEVDTITTGGTASDVVLTANTVAGQSIVDADGNSTITAEQINLNAANGAGAIGTLANRINTTAATIVADAGTGGLFLNENDGASVTATAAGAGAVDIVNVAGTLDIAGATNSGTGTIDLSSGDAITLSAALGGANDGAIMIQANTDGVGAEGFTQNAGATITSGDTSANAISLVVNTAAGGTGGAALGADMTTGAGGTITLDTANGGTTGTGISRTAGTLTATTIELATGNGDIGALAGRVFTDATNLNASAAGSVFVSEADGIVLDSVASTNVVDVVNTAAGTIEVNAVTATNSVVINSQGAITEDATNDAGADISSTAIDLDALGNIGQMEIDATTIDADATGSVTLTNLATAQATVNSVTGTGATLVFADGVSFNGGTANVGGGALAVTVDSGNARTTSLDLTNSTLTFGTFSATGGTDGNDTLIAADAANTWTITANNGGSLISGAGYTVGFAQFGSLTGAANNTDAFVFSDTRTLSGVIEGGTSAALDTLDWSAYTTARSVTLNATGSADGFNGAEASLNAGAANGFLNIDSIIVGQSLDHTLTGVNANSTWDLVVAGRSYTHDGSARVLDLNAAGGTGFVNLTGGSVADLFQLGQINTPVALSINLDGGAGSDTFNIHGGNTGGTVLTGNLNGGLGDDTVNFGASPGVPPANNEFSNVDGIIDLGGGTGDSIDFSASDLVQQVMSVGADGTITFFGVGVGTDLISGGYLGVENVTGNNLGPLVAVDDGNPNVWIITGLNTGTLDGVAFSNFFLQGQTDVDSFEFRTNGKIDLGVDGGSGAGINTILGDSGGGVDALIVIGGASSGTFDADTGDATTATSFTNIDIVQGGPGADTFGFLANNVVFDGEIDGLGGTDTLNLSVLSGPRTVTMTALGATDGYDGTVSVAVPTGFKNIDDIVGSGGGDTLIGPATNSFFFLNASNAGTLSDAEAHNATAAARLTFSGFSDLTGGAGADDFEFDGANGAITGSIDGGLGDDKIDLVTSTLAGITVALNDNGSADGRLGTAAAIAPGGFDNINAVDGRGVDTLQVNNSSQNNWLITGVDEFTLDGSTIPFTGFGGLTGGSGIDIFTFEADGQMTGGISGFTGANTIVGSANDDSVALTSASTGSITVDVGGTPLVTNFTNIQNFDGADPTMSDTLDYSGFAGAINIDIGAGTATGTTSITNFETFVGNATSATNTLTGENVANQWAITADNAGTINAGTAAPRTFSSFANLVGGSGADTFDFSDGISIDQSIVGGGGTDVLDYRDDTRATAVNLTNQSATGIFAGAAGGIAGIESFLASATNAANSLIANNTADTFVVNAANTGTLNGAAFENFQTINAGLGDDIITVNNAGSITTAISGGGGSGDTLRGSGAANVWNITADNAGTLNGSAFTQVENLTAVNQNATLTQAAGVGLSGAMTANTVTVNTAAITTGANPFNVIGDLASTAAAQSITSGGAFNVSGNINDSDTAYTLESTGGMTVGSGVTVGGLSADTNGGDFSSGAISGGDITVATEGGQFTSGTIMSTAAVNIATANGNFKSGTITSTGRTNVNAGTGSLVAGAINANSVVVNSGGATLRSVTTNGSQNYSGPVSFNGNLDGAGIRINGRGGAVNVAGNIDATSLNLSSGGANLRKVTTTGAQTYSGAAAFTDDLTGADLVFNGTSSFNGNILLRSSTNVVDFNAPVIGTGNLDIIPTADTDIIIGNGSGAGHIAASQFGGFQGHLIIGALLDPLDSPSEDAVVVSPPGVTANLITIEQTLVTAGDVTLIGSNINLDAGISSAPGTSQVTLVAVGDSQSNGGDGPGDITGPISGTAIISAGKAVLIANSTVVNAGNVRLDLGGGELFLAASANEDEPAFDPSSNATSVDFDPTTIALIAGLGLELQSVQVVFSNPASALTGLQNVQFIDVGLFEEELSLFGVIGNGIAMSLNQCEEAEGCAPNVSEEELEALIVQIEGRIADLKNRMAAGTIDEAQGQSLLSGFEQELENFESYKTQLSAIAAQEDSFDDDFGELDDFADELEGELLEDDFAEPLETDDQPDGLDPSFAAPIPDVEFEAVEEAFEELDDAPIEDIAEPEEFEELEEELDDDFEELDTEDEPQEFEDFDDSNDEFEELSLKIDDALIMRLTQSANVNEHRGVVGIATNGKVVWSGDIVLPSFARRY